MKSSLTLFQQRKGGMVEGPRKGAGIKKPRVKKKIHIYCCIFRNFI